MRWSLFFYLIYRAAATTLLKKRMQHKFFPLNLKNFTEYFFISNPPGDCFWIQQYDE